MAASDDGSASPQEREIATLGGGCFWCLEPVFAELVGVESAVCGYSGGQTPNPTYQQVCSGRTGHAEVVQVTFDPTRISYADVLRVFFSVHDPTTANRQGADVGTQYRSIILYRTPDQQRVAGEVIQELHDARIFDQPIVTQVVPFEQFYRAEEYHQNYYANNPAQGYCRVIIAPKLAKFRKQYSEALKV